MIEQVIQRTREINRNERLAYRVRWLALFGSVLAGVERPNDVDVACSLKARFNGERQQIVEEECRLTKGSFANNFEWAVWPKIEVLKKLKAGSHRLSIQEFDSSALAKLHHRLIFSDELD